MLGFTYNGIHSSTFGLYYIPGPEDRWFNDPEYDVYDTEVSWKNGGYYYDSKAKNRTFTIKCMFEEIDIATRQKVKQWVRRGSFGRLIFDDKPFVYWNVHPTKIPTGNWYLDTDESHSGTVTFTFTAYEPFGYLTRNSNSIYDDDNAGDYCNLIPSGDMPSAPSTSSTTFNVYNPGTEDCGLIIDIKGSATNPIRFYNNANKTQCVIGSLPAGNLRLTLDGDTGYVSVGNNGENGFAYHDRGFVRLSPNNAYYGADYIYRGMNGTKYVFEVPGVFLTDDMVNGVIIPDDTADTTFTIDSVNTTGHRLTCTRTGSGTPGDSGNCNIFTYNKIDIQEKVGNSWSVPTTLSMNSIIIDYYPRTL